MVELVSVIIHPKVFAFIKKCVKFLKKCVKSACLPLWLIETIVFHIQFHCYSEEETVFL